MKYYSTRNKSLKVDLEEAVLRGLASDGGLFMPESFPQFNMAACTSFSQTAFEVSSRLIGDALPSDELKQICTEVFDFPVPILDLGPKISIIELFHGPTFAFKDFGARFMARLVSALRQDESQQVTVLVATSGDTGGAVAQGFHNVPGIDVVLLYPSKKVSPLQEKQLTTIGGNITAVEVAGTFDDCQAMVKTAFSDNELSSKLNLTAANSINIARLIAQMFYYVHAVKTLSSGNLVFSVPCGNFGNLTAGLFAKQMGLPIKKFIAATNINDAVPKYFKQGSFEPKPSKRTVSNAMDVGAASNFERLMDLFEESLKVARENISPYSFSDKQTLQKIKACHENHDYLIDPHGAVALLGADAWLEKNPDDHVVVLGTAHPAKFREVIEQALGFEPEIPASLAALLEKEKISLNCSNDYQDFKKLLLGR